MKLSYATVACVIGLVGGYILGVIVLNSTREEPKLTRQSDTILHEESASMILDKSLLKRRERSVGDPVSVPLSLMEHLDVDGISVDSTTLEMKLSLELVQLLGLNTYQTRSLNRLFDSTFQAVIEHDRNAADFLEENDRVSINIPSAISLSETLHKVYEREARKLIPAQNTREAFQKLVYDDLLQWTSSFASVPRRYIVEFLDNGSNRITRIAGDAEPTVTVFPGDVPISVRDRHIIKIVKDRSD